MTILINYALLFLSLSFLGSGYYFRTYGRIKNGSPSRLHQQSGIEENEEFIRDISHGYPLKLSAIGWFFLGLYWILLVPEYLNDVDMFNALLCIGALPFFSYIAYIEWSSNENKVKKINNENKVKKVNNENKVRKVDNENKVRKVDNENEIKEINRTQTSLVPEDTGKKELHFSYGGYEGLRFLSGITVISLAGYTIVSGVPIIEGSMEYMNAYLVSAFLSLFGYPAEAGSIDYSGNPLWFRSNDLFISVPILHDGQNDVHITLSCTAFPSMLLFSSAIIGAKESFRIKIKTFLLTVPVIFSLNILRMSIIVYLTYTGITSADFAHHVVGKTGSLFALLFLAWVLFTFLPSILDNIEEVYNILLRKDSKESLD